MSFQRWHAPGCARPVDHAAACASATPPVAAVLRDMGCPPLALRLIEATVAAKFSEPGKTRLHLERDDLRAILGGFLLAYEEARPVPSAPACARCGGPDVIDLCRRCL